MARLLAVIRYSIPLLILLYICSPVHGQVCNPDQIGQLQQLTLGPISFKLKNSTFTPTTSKIVNFTCFVVFNLKAPAGSFTYKTDTGTVIDGKVTDFRLDGELAIGQGPDKNALNIRAKGFDVTLLLTKPLKTVAYGGTVSLAAKEEILISNAVPISFSEKAKPTGAFQIRTSNKLAWQGAVVEFAQLPDPIKLDLTADTGTTLDKEFELPLDTGNLRVTRADFSYTLPTSITAKTFPLKQPNYRAVVSRLKLTKLSLALRRDDLKLQIKGLSGSGEFTGKIVKSSPVPVLFNGKASVAEITGTAPFSPAAARIEGIKITGLQLRPTSITQNALAKNTSINPILLAHSFQPLNNEPPEPQASGSSPLQPADFFTPSTGQVNAMKEMGIPTLSQQQLAAISSSRATVQTMGTPNFLINYPAIYFRSLLEEAASRFDLKLLTDPKFGRQELLLLVSFKNGPLTLGQGDAMKFVFHIIPSIEKRTNPATNQEEQVLILRYKIGLARLDQTELSNTVSPDDITGAVDDQVGQADSASQDPTPLSITLPVDIAKPFQLNKSFTDPTTKATVAVSSKSVQAKVSVSSSVLLIDEQGVHVLGVLEAK